MRAEYGHGTLEAGGLRHPVQTIKGVDMEARPVQSDYFRWGGMAAVVGGGLGIVLNLIHPRTTENVGNVRSHLEMIAGSDMWNFVHAGLVVAIAIGMLGIIAIALSMAGTSGELWARTWLVFSALSSAVLLITLAIDGAALKVAADRWAGSGDDAVAFAAAAGVEGVATALFTAGVLTFFGIGPLLLAMAVMTSGTYPKSLGQVSMAAGALGVLTALLLWLQGGATVFNSIILFPIASLLGTLVLMWAGWTLYKSNGRVGASGRATTERMETPVTPGL